MGRWNEESEMDRMANGTTGLGWCDSRRSDCDRGGNPRVSTDPLGDETVERTAGGDPQTGGPRRRTMDCSRRISPPITIVKGATCCALRRGKASKPVRDRAVLGLLLGCALPLGTHGMV